MSEALFHQMTISRPSAPRAALRELLATWRRRVWERTNLNHLEDRDLHDLGLSRAAAEYEAGKPFWRA